MGQSALCWKFIVNNWEEQRLIQKNTCKNGVRIVFEPIDTVRSVSIGVWVRVGSGNEHIKNNGISHFIEHMFFKGTKNRTAKEIAQAFDKIGGQVNAFTSKECTCYYAKVMDTYAQTALDILADMFFCSQFAPEEMAKEKNVVLEEIKMYEDSPDDYVHDLLAQTIFGDHPLGYSILGREENLQALTSEDLHQYVKKMYRPEEVVISVAGNVDAGFVHKIEALFSTFEASDTREDMLAPPIFLPEKTVQRKDTEQAHLCLGFPGIPLNHPDMYGLIVLNNILGGTMSSRLFQNVREEKGLAYAIYSYHTSYQSNGSVTIYGGTAVNQLNELYETILMTLKELQRDSVTDEEIKNTKEQLKGSLMLSLESTNSRMSRNGKNELLMNKQMTLDEVVTRIDAVDRQMINRMIEFVFGAPHAIALISSEGKLPVSYAV